MGKAFLILKISSAVPLVAWAKDLVLLWYLNLAKTLVLGLGGIEGGVLEILARLSLWFTLTLGMAFLLKFDAMYC